MSNILAKFAELEADMRKQEGNEAVFLIRIMEHETTIVGYLPEKWDIPYFMKMSIEMSKEVEERFGTNKLLNLLLVDAEEFLRDSPDKDSSLRMLNEIRDGYIHKLMNS